MADSYAGRISKARSNDDMIFEGTRNIVLSAASNGSVGIGTSNPTAPLHVVGNAYIDGRLHVLNHSTTGGLRVSKHASGPFNPNAPSVVMNDAFLEIADRDGYTFSNASSNDIVLFQTNSNQSFQIGASIGARANITLTKLSTVIEAADNIVLRTNGSNALSIGQSGYVTLANGLVTPSFATCNLYTGSGTQSRPSHSFSNDDGTGLFQPGPGSMAIATSSTERIRFNSNGYIGIGTTTPERQLDVNGTVKAIDFMEVNVSLANKYAPSNETTTRLNVLDSNSTWTSNTLSNFANNAITNDAINRIDAMAFAGCNAAIWSSNNAYWLSNTRLPQYALSNDIFPIVTYTSNTLSNVTMLTQFTPTSNASFWASNELLTRPTGATVDLLYAKSNDTFRSIASNTVRSEWVSNLSVWSSNSIVYTSNALFSDYPTKVDASTTYATHVGLSNVSSQSTFGCNAGTWASNSLSNANVSANFGSNTSLFASNTAVFASNSLPNYVLSIDAEMNYARSNGQSNWNFGSNTAHWGSNAAFWASNTSLTTSIASNNYARSNQQSNWNYASNTAFDALEKSIFSSNAFVEYSKTSEIDAAYAKSNAQSNWNYASNQSVVNTAQITWGSNELQYYQKTASAITNFAQSNAQSNWVYASNTSTDALSRSLYASNVSTWSSNSSSNYALLSSQSNWIYASNTASATSIRSTWASNNSSNVLTTATASNAYAASNAQSNWVFGSNTALWASNEVFSTRATAMWASNGLLNVATTEGTSNWNYASNTAVWASNTAFAQDQIIKWTSNSLFDKTDKINNSNWNYASNTAFWASNNTRWTSNALLDKLNIADATILFAASNTLSNLNYASNTSLWASNTTIWASNNSSNVLSLAIASNVYALSNAQSNWNYASNTAFDASNLGYWTSNKFSMYTNTIELNNILSNYAPSNTVNAALTNISTHLNAASNTVYGCNGAIIIWASNNFRNYITTIAANNTNAAIYGSNTSTWTSNNLNDTKLALSNKLNTLSNIAYTAANNVASNGLAGIWSSNKLTDYVLITNASATFLPSAQYLPQITWTSNTVNDTSNFAYALSITSFSSFAASNRQSNWNFGSNTASWSSNTAFWGSNIVSNLLSLSVASNAYAASNAQSNWVYASNTAFWGSNNGSNMLSLTVASNAYAASNAQSNWVYASNAAFWGSNNGSNLLSLTVASNAYAASNAQSNWVFASNTSVWSSNTAFWGSNNGSNLLSLTVASNAYAASNAQSNWVYASNAAFWGSNNGSNLLSLVTASNAYAASNGQSNWVFASNTSFWASNSAGGRYWQVSGTNTFTECNVGIGTATPEYLLDVNGSCQISGYLYFGYGNKQAINLQAFVPFSTTPGIGVQYETTYFRTGGEYQFYKGGQHADAQGDAGAGGTALMTIKSTGNVGIGTTTPSYKLDVVGDINTSSGLRQGGALISTLYAASNGQSNWVFASNTAFWGSNNGSNLLSLTVASNAYAASNAQSNWVFASNTAFWGSNNGSNLLSRTVASNAYAASNGQSNWVFASNTSVWSSNTAFWGSNNGSNLLSLTVASNAYAASNGQSNWVFASNTAFWGSNNGSNLLSRTVASNAYAASNAQSNWVFASNTSVWSSNTAFWGSNNGSNLLSETVASNAYAASNAQSNWVFASNTAFWGSNNGSNLLSRTVASNAYAASNAQSNWVFASNTAFWSSNNGSNLLSETVASNAYAASNAQSNWVFASNTAFWSSNRLITGPVGYWSLSGSAITTSSNVGINTTTPGYDLDINGTCQITSNLFFGSSNRQMINLWGTSHAIGVQNNTTYFRTGVTFGEYQFYQGGVHNDAQGNAGTGGTALMTIKSTGNVGIGTASPIDKLQVVGGDIGVYNGGNASGAGGSLTFGIAAYSNFGEMASIKGGLFYTSGAYSALSGDLVFSTRPSNISSNTTLVERMRITQDGKIGIGTTSPEQALDVDGIVLIAPTTRTELPLRVLNSTQSNNNTTGVVFGKSLTNYNSSWVNFNHLGTDSAQSNYMSLGLWGQPSTGAPLTLNGYGRVGVNTNTPAYTLDVNGVANFKFRDNFWIKSADDKIRLFYQTNSTTYFGTQNGYEWRNSLDSNIGSITNTGNFSVPGEIISTGANNTIAQFRAVSGGYGMIFRNDGGSFYMLPTNLNDPYGGWAVGINWPFIYNFSDRRVFLNGNTVINQNGSLGVGTTPSYPLHISTFTNSGTYSYGYLNSTASIGTATTTSSPISIWADYRCVALEFNAKSDVRIKKDVTDVDDASALNLVRNIQPKQYKYIDTVAKGSNRVWGFIAQQIESVMEYAVTTTVDYIPNVFDHALSYDGGTKLRLEGRESSCMYVGKLVKVYVDDENKFEETMVESIIDSHAVLCNPPLKLTGRVFVYGQQVDDFKTLNKDAIFTVGIAAIQELDRELQQLTARIEALEARI